MCFYFLQMLAARSAGDGRMFNPDMYVTEGNIGQSVVPGHPMMPTQGGQYDMQIHHQIQMQQQLQLQQQIQMQQMQQMQAQQQMEIVPHPGVNMAGQPHLLHGHYAMPPSPGKHFVTPPYMNYTVPPPQHQPPPPPTSPSTPSISRMSSPPPATSAAASFFAR